MDSFVQDLRFALRQLIKHPGFTLVAVATLGLGIGANAGIFTIANTLFLKPPAQVERPSELVSVYTSDFSGPRYSNTSWPDYLDFTARSRDVLAGLASFAPRPVALSTGTDTRRSFEEEVSGNYFDVLGVRPVAGHFFAPDGSPEAAGEPTAVIGFGLWQRVFGGNPGVIGRTVRLNGQQFTVIGVAPAGFEGSLRGIKSELWTPMVRTAYLNPGDDALVGRGHRGLNLIGRLTPGTTVPAAQARFSVIAHEMQAAYPEHWNDVHNATRVITVESERASRVFPAVKGPVMGFIGLLLFVVGLVLLICCANVANLLLVRAAGRQREIAIRLALGVRRSRLVRMLVAEGLLLAGIGGAVGLFIATWTTGLFAQFQPPLPIPVSLDLTPDVRVLLFTLLLAVITGVAFGLIPARQALRADVVASLKDQGNALRVGRRRVALRDVLVVVQVSVSVVLLVLSGLFLRSLNRAQTMDPGFNPSGIVLSTTDLSMQGYDSARVGAFYQQLVERARQLPGVRGVTLAKNVPLGMTTERWGMQVDGYKAAPGEDLEFGANMVDRDYFRTMAVPVLRGREFNDGDRAGLPHVAIVNEALAARFWPGQDPIGKRIGYPGQWNTVVGVVKTGKYGSLGESPQPFFYLPLSQQYQRDLTLHVRSADPLAMQVTLRKLVHDLDPDLPVQITTMTDHLGFTLLPQQVGATVLGLFGALGLVLASIGLYGVLAYLVALRRREIGLRIALGATNANVRRLVMGHALRLSGTGLLIGLVLAAGAGRLASAFLFGVDAADPVTFVAVPLLLGAVALLAGWLPMRRATRMSPSDALRSE